MSSGQYEINPSNLRYAVGGVLRLRARNSRGTESPPCIRSSSKDLSSFVSPLRGLDPRWKSVRDPKEFESVLSDMPGAAPDVDAIVRYSNQRCQVGRLTAVDSTCWPAIVDHSRARFTVANAALYVHRFGLDDTIVKFLNGGRPSDTAISGSTPMCKHLRPSPPAIRSSSCAGARGSWFD